MGKSPKKPRGRPSGPYSPKKGKGSRKTKRDADDSDGSPVKARDPSKRKVKAPKKDDALHDDDDSGAARVSWDKDPTRAERVLDWLHNNVDYRVKLFSDSTQDAVAEGRKKKTGKTPKMFYYGLMADAVFSVDADASIREDYNKKPSRYARSVENFIKRLRKRYGEINKELGQTGAGLRVEDVVPGSEIANKIEKIRVDFPYWEQLHRFWRTLPNFNPFTVSSEPGQDIADQALALLTGDSVTGDSGPVGLFTPDGVERTPERTPEPDSQPISQWSPTPVKGTPTPIDIDNDTDHSASPPPKLRLMFSKKPQALRNSSKPNVLSSGHSSSASSTSSAVKTRGGKRSRAEALAEETDKQNKILAELGKNKHDRRMAELAVKRQKLEVDLQRESLAAEERRLAAEDRRREADHKREREREQHQLMMMRMQFSMQQGHGTHSNGLSGGGSDQYNGGFFGAEMDGDIFGGFRDKGGDTLGYFGGVGQSLSLLAVSGDEE
ncbi:hypothetical protein FB451DRAFT_1176760 [Mycena latifolia]|nr:hypothetical protein FB451DRAFT_1176760 [Mycena latifolia]